MTNLETKSSLYYWAQFEGPSSIIITADLAGAAKKTWSQSEETCDLDNGRDEIRLAQFSPISQHIWVA